MYANNFTTHFIRFVHYEEVCKALENSCSYFIGHEEEGCICRKNPRDMLQK